MAKDLLRYRNSPQTISFGDINETLGLGRTASRTIGDNNSIAYQALSYRVASTPYINRVSNSGTPKVSQWYNYYERPTAWRGTASTCEIQTGIIPTIFNQTAPLYDGIAGGTYTYTGTVQDLTSPTTILTVAVVSTLPGGWTFTQTGNTFTVSGPVPGGADYIITLQVSSSSNSSQQTISINAVYATLKSMEFKVNYRAGISLFESLAPAQGSSIKTTSPITISTIPSSIRTAQHTCDRAQFNLVAGVYVGSAWEWTNLGKVSLNNYDPGQTYNIYDANIPDLAALDYGTAVSSTWVNIAAGVQVDQGNIPVTTYNSSNKLSYYNYGTIDTNDRTDYINITNDMATTLSNKSNWVGSPNRGIVKFKLVANTYNSDGSLFVHSGPFGWMQVFKKNLAGTNQEEVLNSGSSFVMAGTVIITADIINNTVVVTT